jgi:predicted aspartyl protease
MPAYDDRRFTPPDPVARASIRHPDRPESIADFLVLIDSGADATLLPRAAVASLAIEATGERYELVAFDGTISQSEVVQAHLLLMNKRFVGRFLLTDAEIGVIGRNVLNHLRLLLDGPALSWEERPSATFP